jgi:hypothetical protein
MKPAPRTRTLALVESASQLINVVEWAHAYATPTDVRVAVLAPVDSETRRQLRAVGALASAAGLYVQRYELRTGLQGLLRDGPGLLAVVARASRLVVGDPFSGLVQTLLPLVRADEIVVVDDGTATWEFVSCIDGQRPMVRWHVGSDGSARTVRATRALSPAFGRGLTMFSYLADSTPIGARAQVNEYAWTRSRPAPTVLAGDVDVIGASLVESGVVGRADYVSAVSSIVTRFGAGRYLAHRREDPDKLSEIAARTGVVVERPELPVELALRHGPVAERVVTFPSTSAYTLPVVLRGTGVRIEVRGVDARWFTPTTSLHARQFVQRIAGDAPVAQVTEPA